MTKNFWFFLETFKPLSVTALYITTDLSIDKKCNDFPTFSSPFDTKINLSVKHLKNLPIILFTQYLRYEE